jgi:tagatose 1,6-diphosphate aldolase GatY/KbaY
MGLVTSKKFLLDAQKNGYGVCGFNIHNLETLKAAASTAFEERAPIILQATPGTVRFAGAEYLVSMAKVASEKYDTPIAMHLDHGEDYGMVMECLRAGFTSIMIDGSQHPYDENIAMVKKVVEAAHLMGVPVEAELGKIGGIEDDLVVEVNDLYTDPKVAVEFIAKTGIDSLAIAIGTAHGLYKKKPQLDFDRLAQIRQKVSIPLVLHGASDLPDESVRKCIELGINKINIATELKIAFSGAIKTVFDIKSEESDPRKLFTPGVEAMKAVVKNKIYLTGSAGKA